MIRPNYVLSNIDKNNNLNLIRLVLAYIVVIYHSMTLSGQSIPLLWLFDAHLAVCSFFVISGFLIIRSYWRSDSLGNYFIKRGKRLLPAYILVVLLSAFGLSFFSNYGIPEYFRSAGLIKYLLANLSFMNFLHPDLPGVFSGNAIDAVNGSLWTIKIEVGFYLLIPLIALILQKLKTKKQAGLFLVALYVFGLLYQVTLVYISNRTQNDLYKVLAHQLPGFLQYFAVGMFFYINFDLVNKYKNILIIPALGIIALYFFLGNEILLPIALGIVVLFFAFNFPRLNFAGRHNDYSYGTYIFHFPVIQIIVALGLFERNSYLAMLITLLLVFILSFLSWHLVEKKALKRR